MHLTLASAQVWLGAAGVLTLCGVSLARAAFRRTPFGALQPQEDSSSSGSEASSSAGSEKKAPGGSASGPRRSSTGDVENDAGQVGQKRISSGSSSPEPILRKRRNTGQAAAPAKSPVKAEGNSAETESSTAAPPRRSRKTESHQVGEEAAEMRDDHQCQLLYRPLAGFTLDKHRKALTSGPTVTVKALRNVLVSMGETAASSMLKDELIDTYLASVHGADAVQAHVPAAAKRKSAARASEVVDLGTEGQRPAMAAGRKSAPGGASGTDAASAAPEKKAAKRESTKASGEAGGPVSPGDIIEFDRCRYQVDEKLAPGADSTIFKGRCIAGKYAGHAVAIKVQPRGKKTVYQVTTEYTTLRALHAKPHANLHIQTPLGYGCHQDAAYVLVSGLLGPNVLSLVPASGAISPRTVLLLALQGVPLLEALHTNGYVHRDIKPDNIVISPGKSGDQLYLIDFGTAESLFDRKGVRKTTPQAAEGTLAYMAMSVHQGAPFSPRDDLEAFGWMLLRLLVGKLPWEGLGLKDMPKILAAKKRVSTNPDLEGVSKPMQDFFKTFFGYVTKLDATCSPEHSMPLSAIVEAAWASNKKEYGSMPAASTISFK